MKLTYETAYLPDKVSSLPSGPWLILAPHPDDETFGMGGALLLAKKVGIDVDVIFLTDGGLGGIEQEDLAAVRETEARIVAKKLAIRKCFFWGEPDRGLMVCQRLIDQLKELIKTREPKTLFFPSLQEPHPDHRAAAFLAWESLRQTAFSVVPLSYDISVQGLSNYLIDISSVIDQKREAMLCYASQLSENKYIERILGLNQSRAWSLPLSVSHAESFYQWPKEDRPINALLMSKLALQCSSSALPAPSPLVSVITRTQNRPDYLREAIRSVVSQTYSNIELIVVNDGGKCCKALVKEEATGHIRQFYYQHLEQQAGRSHAANVGLELSTGEFLIFLDDDDLLLPEHLTKLIGVLLKCSDLAAYSGVSVVNSHGDTVRVFDEPWSSVRLRGANFIPIHAVVFDRAMFEVGCRFDESLGCLEDWDFWLQISSHTSFRHVPGVSAIYRSYLGNSPLTNSEETESHLANRAAIFEKWLSYYTPQDWVQTQFWFEEAVRTANATVMARDCQLADRESQIDVLRQDIAGFVAREVDFKRIIDEAKQSIDEIKDSTSWKMTAPLRFCSRLATHWRRKVVVWSRRVLHDVGRGLYWRLPSRWRDQVVAMAYRLAGPVFRGLGHYEMWRRQTRSVPGDFLTERNGTSLGLVDLVSVHPLREPPIGRIAIHLHIFYVDLASEFAEFMRYMPFPYDLFVSVTSEADRVVCEQVFFDALHMGKLTVVTVSNRGRDIAPFFCVFGMALQEYTYVAHLHSKKSLYNNGKTAGWLEYILRSMLGSELQIRRIFSLLAGKDDVGFVYPQNFSGLPYLANTWLANKGMGRLWCRRLELGALPEGYFDFPAGSMFWARVEALQPLFDAGIRNEDFPEEAGQTDGTFAHCLERILGLVPQHVGFKTAIIRDREKPSWSAWRFEQYVGRCREYVEAIIASPEVCVVVFDIFDTLLTRPLLDPESIKILVAKRAAGSTGEGYLAFRAEAEEQARQKAGRDVGLDEVFKELAVISSLAPEEVKRLRCLEEEIEFDAVSLRSDAVSLLFFAVRSGKRVVLASDMYLPKGVVESMLVKHNIIGWHVLYLSSDRRARKDCGVLYDQILAQEGIAVDQILVVGDNEHSDWQIPLDMGAKVCHVLRPVELARSLPRLRPVLESSLHRKDINAQLCLGLIVQKNFGPLYFPHFNPNVFVSHDPGAIGYSVLGPVVLSFVQWLMAQAMSDDVQRLYFLAREGEFLKKVYDRWLSLDESTAGPPSRYLIVSRRVMTVPVISSFEDIISIASVTYYPNRVDSFLKERYGVEMEDTEWDAIYAEMGWRRDRLVEVKDGKTDHLQPLLKVMAERIIAQSQDERPGLRAYLKQEQLMEEGKFAVVDVGYSATIQDRLNRFLDCPVHGYYMATNRFAEAVSLQHQVDVHGCFAHYSALGPDAPAILARSFCLEKLLSSDDAQIVNYRVDQGGGVLPEKLSLSEAERQAKAVRDVIRKGAMEFVDDAIFARRKLCHDFTIPVTLANSLFAAFAKRSDETEEKILHELVLDDYYCGRGLVR